MPSISYLQFPDSKFFHSGNFPGAKEILFPILSRSDPITESSMYNAKLKIQTYIFTVHLFLISGDSVHEIAAENIGRFKDAEIMFFDQLKILGNCLQKGLSVQDCNFFIGGKIHFLEKTVDERLKFFDQRVAKENMSGRIADILRPESSRLRYQIQFYF